MCEFFAVTDVIHPNPFTVHRPFSHGFVEKISNNGMLCVSLVQLGCAVFFLAISPRIQSLEVQEVLDDSLAASV